jgi:hypothetical protein
MTYNEIKESALECYKSSIFINNGKEMHSPYYAKTYSDEEADIIREHLSKLKGDELNNEIFLLLDYCNCNNVGKGKFGTLMREHKELFSIYLTREV